MTDHLVRSLSKEVGLRAFVCNTTELVQTLCTRHQTAPTTTVAFGRALTGAALMGALLKIGQRVALRFEGDGPLHLMIVESDHYGRIRGYPYNPEADLPLVMGQFDVGNAIGHGVLTVVKDLQLKELVRGVVPLATGEIDKDIELYLNQSEQVASYVLLGVQLHTDHTVAAAGGILLQVMPNYDVSRFPELIDRIESLAAIEQLLLEGKTSSDILEMVFAGIAYTILEEYPLEFRCGCSRESSQRALLALERTDLEQLIAEGQATIDCHFCHESYVFTEAELQTILDSFGEEY